MNLINGQPHSHYGLILSKLEGALDMPARLGNTHYDWGDFLEPLVDPQDIAWQERNITLSTFFDGRRYHMSLTQALARLKGLSNTFYLHTNYGRFHVKLKEVIKQKGYTQQYATLKLVFNENTPNFQTRLPPKKGGNSPKIDGYSFQNDLGIVISQVKFAQDIPQLQPSHTTVFNTPKPLASHRAMSKIQLTCTMPYTTNEQLTETTENIKKILAQSGMRTLIYAARSYSCYLTEGFKMNVRKNLAQFNLTLNIATRFLEMGFVAPGFVDWRITTPVAQNFKT